MLKVSFPLGFLILISFFICEVGLTQKLKTESITLKIGENSLKGTAVMMDFDKEVIFKAWWKFSKRFSRTQTKKDQIMHTIPAVEGVSTESVSFYSRVEKVNDSSSRLSAVLDDDGMSNDDVNKYQGQIRKLLIDFRLKYYTNNLQLKITETEKKAAKVSRNLDRLITDSYKLNSELTKAQARSSEQVIAETKNRILENQRLQNSPRIELQKIQKLIEDLKLKLVEVQ